MLHKVQIGTQVSVCMDLFVYVGGVSVFVSSFETARQNYLLLFLSSHTRKNLSAE